MVHQPVGRVPQAVADGGFYGQLTPRERHVMHYVAMGKPNKIIAAELGISQRTIEAHRARIFQKMRVRNAVELARCLLLHEPAPQRTCVNGQAGRRFPTGSSAAAPYPVR